MSRTYTLHNKNYYHATCEPCSGFDLGDVQTPFYHPDLVKQAGPAVLDRFIQKVMKTCTQIFAYMTGMRIEVLIQIQNIRK